MLIPSKIFRVLGEMAADFERAKLTERQLSRINFKMEGGPLRITIFYRRGNLIRINAPWG